MLPFDNATEDNVYFVESGAWESGDVELRGVGVFGAEVGHDEFVRGVMGVVEVLIIEVLSVD